MDKKWRGNEEGPRSASVFAVVGGVGGFYLYSRIAEALSRPFNLVEAMGSAAVVGVAMLIFGYVVTGGGKR